MGMTLDEEHRQEVFDLLSTEEFDTSYSIDGEPIKRIQKGQESFLTIRGERWSFRSNRRGQILASCFRGESAVRNPELLEVVFTTSQNIVEMVEEPYLGHTLAKIGQLHYPSAVILVRRGEDVGTLYPRGLTRIILRR
jgi:hypothetical protein